ncbi:MAG TPA: hypothetical protein VG937_12875 [Polyangiaceae bacterium]|nr:hypothetical protein [Polyangiaceae bacterium]
MRVWFASLSVLVLTCAACSAGDPSPSNTGGSPSTGGSTNTGGTTSTGGTTTGGVSTTGGSVTTTGGTTGGTVTSTGGTAPSTGGTGGASGSNATGGSAGGSSTTGGVSSAGAAGAPTTGGQSTGGAGGQSTGGNAGQSATGGAAGGAKGGGTILLKDNFDATTVGGPPDSTKWMAPVVGDNNQPVIDTSRTHSAPNSAKITASSTGNSFLVFSMGLPTANNRVYVRAFVNFEKATTAITGHVGYIVGAASRDNSGTELRFGSSTPPGFSGSMLDLNLQNPMDGGGGEVTRFSNTYTTGGNPLNMPGKTLEANKWYCIEALFSGTPSEFNLWIDGAELTALHVTDFDARGTTPRTMWAPSFKFLKFGAQNYGGDAGMLWYDDVVVGTERVGCTL